MHLLWLTVSFFGIAHSLDIVPVAQDAVYPIVNETICSDAFPNGACPKAGTQSISSTCSQSFISFNRKSNTCIAPTDAKCVYSAQSDQHQCEFPYLKFPTFTKAVFPSDENTCGFTRTTKGTCPQQHDLAIGNCSSDDLTYNTYMGRCVAPANSLCHDSSRGYQCNWEISYYFNILCKFGYFGPKEKSSQCPRRGQRIIISQSDKGHAEKFFDLVNDSFYAPEDAIYDPSLNQCFFPNYAECRNAQSEAGRVRIYFMVVCLFGFLLIGAILYKKMREALKANDVPDLPTECIVEEVPPMAIPVGDNHRASFVNAATLSPLPVVPISSRI